MSRLLSNLHDCSLGNVAHRSSSLPAMFLSLSDITNLGSYSYAQGSTAGYT